MTTAPRVSVILPVYNGSDYLAAAIESVLTQTMSDFELIIVDDGSEDDSYAIARRFAARDERRRVRVLHQPRGGVSTARNLAIAMAACEWLSFLDHDDVMLPHRLERQLEFAAKHPEVAAFGHVALYINAVGREIGGRTAPNHLLNNPALPLTLLQSTVMLRAAAVRSVGGYDESLLLAQDVDLWLRLAEQGYHLLQQDDILTKYRVHSDSTMAKRGASIWMAVKWIAARAEARASGTREPTYAQFLARWEAMPLLDLLGTWRRRTGWALYRSAGVALANGDTLRGLLQLAVATVLRPTYVARRLSAQLGYRVAQAAGWR